MKNFTQVPNEFVRTNPTKIGLTNTAKFIKIYLATYNPCYPSEQRIADSLECHVNTVKKSIKMLERTGHIIVHRQIGKNNIYEVIWDIKKTSTPESTSTLESSTLQSTSTPIVPTEPVHSSVPVLSDSNNQYTGVYPNNTNKEEQGNRNERENERNYKEIENSSRYGKEVLDERMIQMKLNEKFGIEWWNSMSAKDKEEARNSIIEEFSALPPPAQEVEEDEINDFMIDVDEEFLKCPVTEIEAILLE